MFKNVGEKIKSYAKLLFGGLLVIILVFGLRYVIIAMSLGENEQSAIALLSGLFLILFFGIYFMNMYGFGEIVECIEKIEQKVTNEETNVKIEKMEKLVKLREKGLITEKEYHVYKSKIMSLEDMLQVAKKKFEIGEITEQQYADVKAKILGKLL